MHILALSGSLRAQSLNALLLQEAAWLAPPDLEVMSLRVVPEASLCLTLARSGLDEGGQLKNPAQATALRAALDWLAAAGEAS